MYINLNTGVVSIEVGNTGTIIGIRTKAEFLDLMGEVLDLNTLNKYNEALGDIHFYLDNQLGDNLDFVTFAQKMSNEDISEATRIDNDALLFDMEEFGSLIIFSDSGYTNIMSNNLHLFLGLFMEYNEFKNNEKKRNNNS
jgi:hypothetical protein